MKDTPSRLQWILIIVICLFMAACAAGPNSAAGTPAADGNVYGFWYGLWHGMIALPAFIIGLFESGVRAYEVHNNGNWYDLGFLMGIGAFASSPAYIVRRHYLYVRVNRGSGPTNPYLPRL